MKKNFFKVIKNKYFYIFTFLLFLTYQSIPELLNYELDYKLESNDNHFYNNVNKQEE